MFEKIIFNKLIAQLSSFAESISKQLYVVGGAVRDIILGKARSENITDFDLCGTMTLDDIIKFAETNGIKHKVKNKKLQVVMMEDSIGVYEYARLRTEEYKDGITHTPSKIEFVEDVIEDAKRRDFTINSVYYVTHSTRLIDPFCGIDDIKKRRLQTVLDPNKTLSVDPARILRLVEAACRFELNIDDNLMAAAKKYATNIQKLSPARLKKEIARIFTAPKYDEEKNKYLSQVNSMLDDLDIKDIVSHCE